MNFEFPLKELPAVMRGPRMERRRVEFKLGLTYQTPYEQLVQIPEAIKAIVHDQELAIFDRAHFASYADSSLDFVVVYNLMSSDYNKYMDVQQAINLRIFKEFQQRKIEFAYPTRTLFVTPQPEQQA